MLTPNAFGNHRDKTAFVNVTVIPMDREGYTTGQTILVENERISRVGNTEEIPVPTDYHVHRLHKTVHHAWSC